MTPLANLLPQLKIIPVLTVETVEDALNVCTALEAGGIKSVEITLRTAAALEAIKEVKQSLPKFTVAAGTIKTTNDIETLAKLGISFGVSPGLTEKLVDCAQSNNLPLLPGIATASELMQGLDLGLSSFKLFPAAAVGGIPLLKSLYSPFQEATFCPTGGISPDNYKDYLNLPNVLCVGGSWMVAPDLIAEKQCDKIEALSKECMGGM